MIAKLIFDLRDPEEDMLFLRAVRASEMASILFELQNNFVRKYKKREKDSINIEELSKDIQDLIGDLDINCLIK